MTAARSKDWNQTSHQGVLRFFKFPACKCAAVTFQWIRNLKTFPRCSLCVFVGAKESLKEGTPREVGNSLVHVGTAAITTPRGVGPMLAWRQTVQSDPWGLVANHVEGDPSFPFLLIADDCNLLFIIYIHTIYCIYTQHVHYHQKYIISSKDSDIWIYSTDSQYLSATEMFCSSIIQDSITSLQRWQVFFSFFSSSYNFS